MQKEVWYYEKWVEGTEKCLFCENKQCLYETFLISSEKFYLVLKKNQEKLRGKKIIDSEFVKTCHKHVKRF